MEKEFGRLFDRLDGWMASLSFRLTGLSVFFKDFLFQCEHSKIHVCAICKNTDRRTITRLKKRLFNVIDQNRFGNFSNTGTPRYRWVLSFKKTFKSVYGKTTFKSCYNNVTRVEGESCVFRPATC